MYYLDLSNARLLDNYYNADGIQEALNKASEVAANDIKPKKGITDEQAANAANLFLQLTSMVKRDPAAKAQRQSLKAVCGKRPLFKGAKRNAYEKCALQYEKNKTESESAARYTPTPYTPEKTGLSTGAWIGISIGGVVLLGATAYFIFRKK